MLLHSDREHNPGRLITVSYEFPYRKSHRLATLLVDHSLRRWTKHDCRAQLRPLAQVTVEDKVRNLEVTIGGGNLSGSFPTFTSRAHDLIDGWISESHTQPQ